MYLFMYALWASVMSWNCACMLADDLAIGMITCKPGMTRQPEWPTNGHQPSKRMLFFLASIRMYYSKMFKHSHVFQRLDMCQSDTLSYEQTRKHGIRKTDIA